MKKLNNSIFIIQGRINKISNARMHSVNLQSTIYFTQISILIAIQAILKRFQETMQYHWILSTITELNVLSQNY